MASASTSTVLSEKKNVHNLNNSGNSAYSKSENALRYRDWLNVPERERYAEKIQLIKGQDPYEIAAWSTNVSDLPSTTYMDIVNYLLFTTSAYTNDQLRSYKGLDAYNQFVCGWVRDTGVCIINNKCIVTAKVLHSQR
ncbi:hypothetical protein SNE40_005977 [Patella caerulea]|uniref:Uncharacterized protein n=1 Tax=Patella caerulea TaxID=87958 RepID=A0AAN8K6I2_PATCE